MISFILLFIVKFIDQVLRTSYLISIKKELHSLSTLIVGIQQVIFIGITVYIVYDFSITNVIALVSSTMIATYLITTRFNK